MGLSISSTTSIGSQSMQLPSSSLQRSLESRRLRTDNRRTRSQKSKSSISISTACKEATICPPARVECAVPQLATVPDTNDFGQLVVRHTAKLRRIAFNILHNKEEAEDAVQDGLFKAFQALESFEGRSSVSTWLTRIVINSALMFRRRKKSRPEASLEEILDEQPERLRNGIDDRVLNPEEIYSSSEIRGRVEEHVRLLPPRLRSALELSLGGLTETDSTAALGIGKAAFKARIFRARNRLVVAMRESLNPSIRT
jgi:RNA polymerase sigma-70 factor, ECF subfamily